MSIKYKTVTRTTWLTLFLLAGSALLISGCATTKVSGTAPEGVDLSGTWELNPQLSEDTQGTIAMALGKGRSSRGAGGRSGRGDGMRGGREKSGTGGRGGAGGGDRGNNLVQLANELSPATRKVAIEQSASALVVQYGDQRERQYIFGEETVAPVAGDDAEQISGWQDNQYVIQTETDNGSTVTERFTLSPDGERLMIALTLESKQLSNPVTVTRVFDRQSQNTRTRN